MKGAPIDAWTQTQGGPLRVFMEELSVFMGSIKCIYAPIDAWTQGGELSVFSKFTNDAHHPPTLVRGNCPLSVLVRLVTAMLCEAAASIDALTRIQGGQFCVFMQVLLF